VLPCDGRGIMAVRSFTFAKEYPILWWLGSNWVARGLLNRAC